MTAKNAATTATAAIGKWKLAKDVASENVAAQDSHRNFNLRRLCCRGVEGVGSAAPDKVRTRRVGNFLQDHSGLGTREGRRNRDYCHGQSHGTAMKDAASVPPQARPREERTMEGVVVEEASRFLRRTASCESGYTDGY